MGNLKKKNLVEKNSSPEFYNLIRSLTKELRVYNQNMEISKLISNLDASHFFRLKECSPKVEKLEDASSRTYYRVKTEESSYILCKDDSISGERIMVFL